LFREGDVADCAYVVERGQLEISTTSEHGKVVLKTLGSGELVGEMGVIDSSPRTATATAVGETHLMAVTRDQFTERLSRADSILQLLVNMLLERYRSGLSMVKQRRDPEPREAVVADELIHEYVRDGMDKIRLESELREALTSEQLQVRYQPILDLGNGTIAGFEALTRWQHPVRGAISPGLFIALAEETSLIVPVGLYVLEQACRDIQAIAGDTGEGDDSGPLYVSINVSARQIRDPQFLDQAVEVARAHDLDPGRLLLEITEGLLIDLDQAAEWVTRARSLGFRVALDDFGTGYSSLDTLHRLDLDVVKIDRAFVTPLSENPRSRDLMRGIVAMMKSLRTEIVVEGIETRRQLEFARALDCEYCQGFLIGRSLDIAEARALLAEGVPA
jgi:EAL domain-containing protein (putative c-di-GMP-specific phosphodiesterase class I)